MLSNNKGKKFLSDLKFYSDYSKWREDLGRYESWEESVVDVMNTHRVKYKNKLDVLEPYIEEAEEAYKQKLVLASQRNLQFRGEQIFKHNTRLYNCATAYMDKIEVFSQISYLSLSGCGAGVNMMKKWVSKLPILTNRNNDNVKNYIIPDSIEGWSDAFGILISSFCSGNSSFPEYEGSVVRFDFSKIRPKGALITGGFKAPGSEPLRKSLEKIEQLLFNETKFGSIKFRSIVAYDILMFIADAVLSAGLRRSALSIIVDPDDQEMINAKIGNWRQENKQRERSNNSVGLIRGEFTYEQFNDLVKLNNGMSDIGFCFLNNEFEIFNPCQTKDSYILTPEGIRQFKDISEGSLIWSKEGWTKVLKKWSNGIKPVFKYQTTAGIFKGTENHRIVENGQKIEVKDAESIDIIEGVVEDNYTIDIQDVLDGLVIGDGSKHIAYGNHIVLLIGENDNEYFESEIKDLIIQYRPEICDTAYKVKTTIVTEELPKTYERRVPERFIKNKNKLVGFLRGLYSANGSVCGNRITLKSTSKGLIEDVQLMLNSIGIKSYFTTNKSKQVEFSNGNYVCKESYDLNITVDRAIFLDKIGFIQKYRNDKIKVLPLSCKKNSYKIINTEYLGEEEVFDITVDNNSHTYWTQGCNVSNCFEIQMTPILNFETEETGIELCNLTEINANECRTNGYFDENKFYKACRTATIIGTLQAGYTDFKYLGKTTEEIVKKESLIGVSITGWMNSPEIFNEEILGKGVEIVKEINEKIAEIIEINPAARLTTSKPAGNASVILGCASGIHPEHSKRYFRIMQLNKQSETAKWLIENNPDIIEDSVWSANDSDYVVYCPVETDNSTVYKDAMKGIKHLELIKQAQKYWITKGKVQERCILPKTNNNVSCTVIIDDYEEVAKYVFENQDDFTAVSFLSDFGDKDYPQAPFTSVLTSEELLEKYGDGVMFASGLIVDGLHYFDDNLWDACDHVLNKNIKIEGTRTQVLLKKDWVRRAKQFSKNYFKNDIQKCIYCLKDVHLWYRWNKISKSFKDVDFQEILTKPTFNDVSKYAAIACSGGKCEI
jgi:hypothetical protein